MHDLIIIGAGPAGLTAALYAGRFGLKALVLEKLVVGGRILLSESIENFPGFVNGISTQELIGRMRQQVEVLGIKIENEEALEVDLKAKRVKTAVGSCSARAVIIAAGARPRKLGVAGEERLTGKGVSYCATCDAPLYKGKNVVVVGGGDALAEEALYLGRFAKQVTIVHRRQDLRASAILQERLKEDKKINFLLNSIVKEICGSTKVESVKIKNTVSSEEKEFPCDGVFIFIGYEPETEFLKSKLKLDAKGFIITDETLNTSQEGVFACGDCRSKSLYQVVTACGDGAVAADSAYKYVTRNK